MNEQKSFVTYFAEAVERYRTDRRQKRGAPAEPTPKQPSKLPRVLRWFLPNGGTIMLVLILIATQSVWARSVGSPTAASTSTISYQGRLADTAGEPLTGLYNMEFRIYDVPDGGVPLWEEFWTGGDSVQVSDGLFNVMLGSIDTALAAAIEGHDELYLGITVGTDSEMTPRVQLGSVPFSMQAMTVADGSITAVKLADEAVTGAKVFPGTLRLPHTNFLAGTVNIQGPLHNCESRAGETHCHLYEVVTHNHGSVNYLVMTGTHHGAGAHWHTVSIHSQTANPIFRTLKTG